MEMMAADLCLRQYSGIFCQQCLRVSGTSWTQNCTLPGLSRGLLRKSSLSVSPSAQFISCSVPSLNGGIMPKRKGIHVMSPDLQTPGLEMECLDAWDDEYNGVIIDTECLPSSANAFASVLRASLSNWKLKGKRGIWLKIISEQADLVPIAIQEGFEYHHAEPGYVMLTYWIPNEPCMLPGSPSHQIGVAGFVINEKREVLVVKEKCPCSCSGVWKLPTGYINKYEEIFSGAVREVKEETGVHTVFLEMVAFRHAHRVAFEKSDLLFVCMLKPLSSEIVIDENEIQDAKWMPLGDFIEQSFYREDYMSKKMILICIAAHENGYHGFTAQQLISKLDGRLTFLYYQRSKQI
ncbi:nudix hydrolase 8-like [Durio zibethinus]|uniref:Nudix hydrolase 8-like n=1 Tax=Durio zibethinus TaxID=66656 RepID=A0A6P5ZR73_DURZI|nr:nudix hydrolase 8-like [Durio zibethinus]